MDIARLKGVPYLEPDTRIYPEDLDAWEKEDGPESLEWRRRVHPYRPLGATRRKGSLGGF